MPDLRWHLAESNELPPTTGVFDEHIERVRAQSRVGRHVTTTVRPTLTRLPSGRQRSHTTSTTGYCRVSQVSL